LSDTFDRDQMDTAIDRSSLVEVKARPDRTAPKLWTIIKRIHWGKIALFLISLFFFILAITLMKNGARSLAPLVRDTFTVTNPVNSLGFGWIFAYLVMSGSPVAAAALTFLDAGIITNLGTFTMITGSRLGANFIVLFMGLVYVLRGRNWATSLGMGLLSLVVTGTTYLAGLIIGVLLLGSGILEPFQMRSGTLLTSFLEAVFENISARVASIVPGWGVFLLGLGLIIVSFNLFDRCLPKMTLKESQMGRLATLVFRPGVMFLLGALITLISMSVSVSLSILVPLNDRGFIRRENVIPYIMGANITTFVDTLLASVLINNSSAFTVVLAEMTSITIVSIIILLTLYHRYERMMLAFVNWITSNNRHLTYFLAIIILTPILLLLI
jgi:sodium-dependent phosphate cotransporter